MPLIDFTHPSGAGTAVAERRPQAVRGRQWQPLIGMLRDNQLLLALGNHHYELTPPGTATLTRS